MKKNRKTTEGTGVTATVSESVGEPVSVMDSAPLPPTDLPAHSLTPPPALARVATAECVIAPGINRSDLAITPEFQTDIAQRGVISPLLVRELGQESLELHSVRYEIWAGARRWTAAVKALLPEVPVAIYPAETPTAVMAELRLIENLQREDLTALDEAKQFQEALEGSGYGTGRAAVEALAARIGKSASHVYSRLRLLKAGKAVQKAVASGALDDSFAELLAGIPDPGQQEQALKEILTEGERVLEDGKWKQGPMSIRAARGHVREHYSMPLKRAQFDPEDATLTKAGACSACPWRSGNIRGFEGSPDICTKIQCFAGKTEAFYQKVEAAAKAEGRRVMSEKDFQKVEHSSSYVRLDKQNWEDSKCRTWREILKKDCPPTILARDRNDGLVELLPKETALKAAKDLGIRLDRPANDYDVRNRAEQKKRKEKAGRQQKVAEQACISIALKSVGEPDKKFWRMFAEMAHAGLSYDARERFCKEQWPEAGKKLDADQAIADEIAKHFKGSSDAEGDLRSLGVRLLASNSAFNRWTGEWEEGFLSLCEWAGVDLAKMEATQVELAAARLKTPTPVVKKAVNGKASKPVAKLKVKIRQPAPEKKPDPVKKKPARKGKGR